MPAPFDQTLTNGPRSNAFLLRCCQDVASDFTVNTSDYGYLPHDSSSLPSVQSGLPSHLSSRFKHLEPSLHANSPSRQDIAKILEKIKHYND